MPDAVRNANLPAHTEKTCLNNGRGGIMIVKSRMCVNRVPVNVSSHQRFRRGTKKAEVMNLAPHNAPRRGHPSAVFSRHGMPVCPTQRAPNVA